MTLSTKDREFLEANRSAAMITVTANGVAKAVRVGVALVHGRLWSSGTEDRARTRRLRRDPRCTLFVYDTGFAHMVLETTVTILDGPDVPQLHVHLFRIMQGKPSGPLSWFGEELAEDDFIQRMIDERRVMFEFDIKRVYGMY